MGVRGDILGLPHGTTTRTLIIKVKSMQSSGTEAIRTQIKPSKAKWETTKMFVSFLLNVPVNNFSVMSGRSRRFLGITSTFGRLMYLAQGQNTAT